MATYTIVTTRKQQIGLQFSYDNYADKDVHKTLEEYLQFRVSHQVTNPMYVEQQQAQAISFDKSFNTIPEAEQPKARTEIEVTIISNGGTIVPATPPGLPAHLSIPGGAVSVARGEISPSLQIRTTSEESTSPSGPDGYRDNEA